MAVSLLKAYGTFASGAVVILPDDTETALIAQGLATAVSAPLESVTRGPNQVQFVTAGGNVYPFNVAGQGSPTAPQGPRILPNVPIGAFASLGTSAVHVAGTWYRSEIFVPHWAPWTGISVLNGATIGTDNLMVALYDTNGVLVANSAVAGVLSAGANAFQSIAFTSATAPLAPGRYFVAVQCNGTTATTRRQAAANGGNTMTQSAAGTFGTVPASFTPPTTFTADVGPIASLYQ